MASSGQHLWIPETWSGFNTTQLETREEDKPKAGFSITVEQRVSCSGPEKGSSTDQLTNKNRNAGGRRCLQGFNVEVTFITKTKSSGTSQVHIGRLLKPD